MWSEKIIKTIPAILFLFCLLEIFELILVIEDLNKTEKLEAKIENNLKMLEHMGLGHFKDKGIKVK
ncbi:hypothetical protein [Helicobacter pylori]|uniref:hypothetical protein n=1 Tax=Helicobacter pylori TaxID=210 RepID=UPI001E29B23C|nr:hypothetical protein [Helicobacter pylori]